MDSEPNGAARSHTWIAAAVIVLAPFVAYSNALRSPFVFDDRVTIVDNPTIRGFGTALFPPSGGLPVSGRPLANLSLAANYAIGGTSVVGYHVVNVMLHACAGLALFGVLRRVLPQLPISRSRTTVLLPLLATLLWLLHPLQTEAVTYTVQRTEVLAGLFFLCTLYAFVRATQSSRPRLWLGLSFAACLLGMASKEVMAAAPLLVWLFDRTFFAGSFGAAWRQRRGYYLSLAATWLVLGALVLGTARRGGTAGFGLNITPWSYALTQCEAIVRYLGLALWPHPLAFDYGTYLARSAAVIVPCALLLGGLIAATLVALRRWPAVGFLGACFFAVLAPSSSIVPVATQTIAEHRMYLPLATLIIALVLAGYTFAPRLTLGAGLVLALGLGLLTAQRNETYRSELALWSDTVVKRPANPRARYNLALALFAAGKTAEAVGQSEAAVRLDPTSADSHYNLAVILLRSNRTKEALQECAEALRLRPWMAEAQSTWGVALLKSNQPGAAIEHFEQALKLQPDLFEARDNLGNALLRVGRAADALPHFIAAVRLKPDSANAHNNLASALRQLGRTEEALAESRQALRLQPDFAEAHHNFGHGLLQAHRPLEAVAEYTEALRLAPEFSDAHIALAGALLQLGRVDEGLRHYQEALRLNPGSFEAHYNFANALFQLGRFPDAIAQYTAALQVAPDSYLAHYNLGHARLEQGDFREAAHEFQAAVNLRPASADAQFALAQTLLTLGRAGDAVGHYEAALRLDPASVEAREGLARARALSSPVQK